MNPVSLSVAPEKDVKWPKTVGYSVSAFSFGLFAASIGPALPSLAAHTQTDVSRMGVIFSDQALGFFLGSSLGGRLYDRVPGNPVIGSALVTMALMLALLPLVPFLWLLIIMLVVLGFSAGLVLVGINTLIVWIHQDKVGQWLNGLGFFDGGGALLSPLVVAQALVITGDIIWGFRILALLILLAATWLFRVASPTIPGKSEAEQAQPFNYALVIALSITFLLYVGTEVSFSGWLFTYTLALHPDAGVVAGYLTSAFWGALTVARLLAMPISARVAPSRMLLVSFLGALLSMLLIILAATSLAALWVGTLALGLSMASVFPMLLAYAEDEIKITGRVNGWFFAATALGSMTIPFLTGQVFEKIGPPSTMTTLLVTLLVALGIFVGVLYATHNIKTAKSEGFV